MVQGGSTITQQLVKNAITGDTSQTFQRKLEELALAIKVEQRYTKDEILELYLNDIYFANGVYGIGTAAEYYFHVPASKLTLAQGAMLAGMIRAPNYYNPVVHPEGAHPPQRHAGPDGGARLGAAERIDKAKAKPLSCRPAPAGSVCASRRSSCVHHGRILKNTDGAYDAFGKTEKRATGACSRAACGSSPPSTPTGSRRATGGEPAVPRLLSNPDYAQTPDTAIVSIDNANGAIRTMLSGRNYQRDQLDLATRAAAGSAFKPFTLVAAFQEGIPPG